MKLKNGISLLQFTVDFFNLASDKVITEAKSLDYLVCKENKLIKNDQNKVKKVPIKRKEPLQTNSRSLRKQIEAYKKNKNLKLKN